MTELDSRSAGILRMLIYPIQFDAKPEESIDRVLKRVVYADHLKLQTQDVIAAIDAGLASKTRLSELIPQCHTEDVIRSFLANVRGGLRVQNTDVRS